MCCYNARMPRFKKALTNKVETNSYMSEEAQRELTQIRDKAFKKTKEHRIEVGQSAADSDDHENAMWEIGMRENEVNARRSFEIAALLENPIIIHPNKDTSIVALGVRVRLKIYDPQETPPNYELDRLYLDKADLFVRGADEVISQGSPIGKVIGGKRSGETIDAGQGKRVTVSQILPGDF